MGKMYSLHIYIVACFFSIINQINQNCVLQQERDSKPAGSRRSSANMTPSKTLFVINFDPIHTRTRDLERHFDPYGKILSTRIRRNFAFVQYELQEDATKALEATNMRLIFS
jgi:arginine/serine-rich splicing factor 4/5/6